MIDPTSMNFNFFYVLKVIFPLLLICYSSGCGDETDSGSGSGTPAASSAIDVWALDNSSGANALRAIKVGATDLVYDKELPYHPIALAVDQGYVWVTTYDEKKLLKLSADTGELVATYDMGLPLGPIAANNGVIWIASNDGGDDPLGKPKLISVNPNDGTVLLNIDSTERNNSVSDLYLNEQGLWAMISNTFGISKIDPTTGSITNLALGEEGGYGYGVFAVTPTTLYAVNQYSNEIEVVDTATLTLTSKVAITEDLGSIIVGDETNGLFLTDSDTYQLARFSAGASPALSTSTIALEGSVQDMIKKDNRIFLSYSYSNYGKLVEIDATTGAIVNTSLAVYADHLATD